MASSSGGKRRAAVSLMTWWFMVPLAPSIPRCLIVFAWKRNTRKIMRHGFVSGSIGYGGADGSLAYSAYSKRRRTDYNPAQTTRKGWVKFPAGGNWNDGYVSPFPVQASPESGPAAGLVRPQVRQTVSPLSTVSSGRPQVPLMHRPERMYPRARASITTPTTTIERRIVCNIAFTFFPGRPGRRRW